MYGLANPVSFSYSGSFLPGMNNLFVSASLPPGMLYKRITKIEDALDVGGLILVRSNGDYVFYVGETLRDVLQAGKLGQFVTDTLSLSFVNVGGDARDLTFVNKIEHRRRSAYIYPDGEYSSSMWNPGGLVKRSLCYCPYFGEVATTEVVSLYGIVTGANRGHGVRYNKSLRATGSGYPGIATLGSAAGGWAYVAADTKMNTTFGEFMQNVKQAALAEVPEDVRGFYDSTFDVSLSSASPLEKPTICTAVYWRDNVMTGGVKNGNYVNRQGNPYSGIRRNPVGTSWDTVLAGYAAGPSANLGTGYRNPSTTVAPPSTSELHLAAGIQEWEMVLGQHRPETPLLPAMVEFAYTSVDQRFNLSEGEIGPYKPGVLVDGMLLGRSLVDGIKSQDAVSNYSDLADMVNSTYNGLATDIIDPSPDVNTSEVNAEGMFSRIMSGRSRMSRNVFHGGSLPMAIEKFNSIWDENAKNAAQSSS